MKDRIIKYKGWIVEQDEINIENNNEVIATFYKTKNDYKNRDYSFNISLNKKDFKNNVREYIDNELGENL